MIVIYIPYNCNCYIKGQFSGPLIITEHYQIVQSIIAIYKYICIEKKKKLRLKTKLPLRETRFYLCKTQSPIVELI